MSKRIIIPTVIEQLQIISHHKLRRVLVARSRIDRATATKRAIHIRASIVVCPERSRKELAARLLMTTFVDNNSLKSWPKVSKISPEMTKTETDAKTGFARGRRYSPSGNSWRMISVTRKSAATLTRLAVSTKVYKFNFRLSNNRLLQLIPQRLKNCQSNRKFRDTRYLHPT